MRLTRHDLESLLNFLRQTYTVQSLESFRTHVLRSLPQLVPAEVTAYNEVNVRTQHNSVVYDRPEVVSLRDGERIFDRHIPEHPVIEFSKRRPWHGPVKISDFLSAAQFHKLGLYAEFFGRIGIEDQLVMTLPSPRPVLLGIALNRNRRNFKERERLLLNLAYPHLLQAYRNAEAWTRAIGHLNLLQNALQESAAAVIVVNNKGRVEHMSPRAGSLLTKFWGTDVLRAGRLPEIVLKWMMQQESRLADSSDAPVARQPLAVPHNGAWLLVRLFADTGQSVLLLEESCPAGKSLDAYGLTARERNVLAWVSRGKTNREIAWILGISPRTVQKHMEHIFHKLGVETRTAAASKFLSNRDPDL